MRLDSALNHEFGHAASEARKGMGSVYTKLYSVFDNLGTTFGSWGMKNTEINIPISRNRQVWMRFDNRFKPMVLLMLLCSFLVMSTGAATDAKITIIP